MPAKINDRVTPVVQGIVSPRREATTSPIRASRHQCERRTTPVASRPDDNATSATGITRNHQFGNPTASGASAAADANTNNAPHATEASTRKKNVLPPKGSRLIGTRTRSLSVKCIEPRILRFGAFRTSVVLSSPSRLLHGTFRLTEVVSSPTITSRDRTGVKSPREAGRAEIVPAFADGNLRLRRPIGPKVESRRTPLEHILLEGLGRSRSKG